MKKYIYIGIGGFLGASIRFLIKAIPIETFKALIPINTLVTNITGCFLLAFISTLTLKIFKSNDNLKIGICTGFLGAYTTFSTLCKEAYYIIYQKNYFQASCYIIFSVLLGLTSAYLGFTFAQYLNKRTVSQDILNGEIG